MSDRDAHDQEVQGLERKLTEAEREAAAANVGFPVLLAASSPCVTFLVFPVQHRASVLPSNAELKSSKHVSMFVLQSVIVVFPNASQLMMSWVHAGQWLSG